MLYFARWKIVLILLVCLLGILTALPNLLTDEQAAALPGFLPSDKVTLGLDLQGGAYMLLEVDVEGVIAERLDSLTDDVRSSLRGERIGYTGLHSSGREVSFRLRDPTTQERALELLQDLSQPIIDANLVVPQRDLDFEVQDDQRIVVRLTEAGITDRRISAVSQTIEVIRRRIDETGLLEASIQRQGLDRILIEVPGLKDRQQFIDILETTATMSFHMVDHSVTQQDIANDSVPPGTILAPSLDSAVPVPVFRRPQLTGENLTDANSTFDQNGLPAVSIRFDAQGTRRFGQITAANVGKQFAIILDGNVISAPVINSPILQGNALISGGGMTVEDANNLSILLRAGALPADITILEENTVGAQLGADAIAAGKIAALVGLTAVVVFIILAYGLFGIAANFALAINISLIFGVLSFFGATLTLPGIAGIVLTIGMAVDANVLVFERVREESRLGRSPMSAIDTGYSSALSTILDANITTLIAAVILMQFGSGPIRGFAITLAIGIVTSVFTAVTLTRLMIATWVKKRRPKALAV